MAYRQGLYGKEYNLAPEASVKKAENTGASVTKSVKTGDNTSVIFWGAAVILAAGTAVLARKRKAD